MTSDLELHPDLAPAPTTLFASHDPDVILASATRIADKLAPVISDRHLYAPIRSKKYPTLEAWTLLGGLMPVMVSPHVVRTWQTEDGWGAHAEARTLEGKVVSAADAYCMRDEADWATKPHHQLASMASTRACSRAMRLPLSFVMSLTGYEVTPAEEMEAAARGETVSGGRGVKPGWRDVQEQQREHARLGAKIDERGLREWVATWMASKAYPPRPLAKAQFNQLERAINQELAERAEQSGAGSSEALGDGAPSSPAPDSASEAEVRPERTSLAPTRRVGASASDPTPTSPSAPKQEEPPGVARSGAEGSNHDSKPGVGASLPDATLPPDGSQSPGRPSGGTNRPAGGQATTPKAVRGRQPKSAPATGRTISDPEQAEQADLAAFEQAQADDRNPGRWTR